MSNSFKERVISLSFPLKTEFTGELGFDFKKSAFGNGFWAPVYNSSNCTNGLYSYSQNEKTIIATDVALTYRHKIFAGTVRWHANWKDSPAMENRQNLKNNNISAKKCNKKFRIYNNPLIKDNKQFLQEIMDKIPGIMKIGYQSLRKNKQNTLNYSSESKYLTKQSKKNWSKQKS